METPCPRMHRCARVEHEQRRSASPGCTPHPARAVQGHLCDAVRRGRRPRGFLRATRVQRHHRRAARMVMPRMAPEDFEVIRRRANQTPTPSSVPASRSSAGTTRTSPTPRRPRTPPTQYGVIHGTLTWAAPTPTGTPSPADRLLLRSQHQPNAYVVFRNWLPTNGRRRAGSR